jgi:NAD-dependent deacetylase
MLERIRTANKIVALTGAGVSAESDVPTFRDAQTGLWASFNPQELATPEAFQRNPRRVWDWYAYRREKVLSVSPNPGHMALVEMEKRVAPASVPAGRDAGTTHSSFTLITQNVDGLHQRAGSQNVIELHGNISRVKCSIDDLLVAEWQTDADGLARCPRCNGLLRPDVVWFGEMLPRSALEASFAASENASVFFSIGTSSVVHPAASLPMLALARGGIVIEINPEETALTESATYSLRGKSGEILPELVQTVWGR